ncbi:peptidyl-tRNA hydrolase II domain-containing protein [Crepidotus variabilis]|uniref:peptidyl-tRNA hydrolase n=1 Tax=Crepidotus variabilis TaxID=179855 RepID=A0A9P6EV38_9AGAR|nr:peptidyl-tRNA hydrolase II domain-containing protein [Crepidotus variabilis]
MSSTQSLALQAAVGLALSLTSVGVGYQIGLLFPSSRLSKSPKENVEEQLGRNEETEETEDAEGIPDGDLAAVRAGFVEPCKMVLVVRTDLKLKPGDIASQCCWYNTGNGQGSHIMSFRQAKIALKAKNEDQLQELEAIAKSLNLCARSVRARCSSGIDGLSDGTSTILAIGPAPVNLVNEVTGKLRLL